MSQDCVEDPELDGVRYGGTRGEKQLTCHANGTFLRFTRTNSVAIILEVLPGPVKVFRKAFRMLIREAVILTASAAVKAMDLRGRRAPEAMFKE